MSPELEAAARAVEHVLKAAIDDQPDAIEFFDGAVWLSKPRAWVMPTEKIARAAIAAILLEPSEALIEVVDDQISLVSDWTSDRGLSTLHAIGLHILGDEK